MSKITDLGSPDRELSAGDIKRKQNKLRRTEERLKKAPAGTRQRHRLEFKKLKTEDQIKTGMSGIRPVKKPFKVSHHADLQQEKKFNAPVNNYKEGYYGVERKSALNMLGISRKSSPLNDMTEEENKAKKEAAEMHRVASVNDRYALDITGKYDKEYDKYTDEHGYIDPDEFDKMQKTEEPKQGNDADLDKFFSGIHTIDNPEYADQEGAVSTEHDYFIKNRSEKSDSTAREMMNLDKQAKAARKAKDFEGSRAAQTKINELLEFIKTENENRNK